MRAIELFTGKIYETWMGGTQEAKIREILKNVKSEKNVLDIGSGPGFLGKFIKDSFFVDVDLENLKKVNSAGYKVLANGSKLPFKDKSFKTVFCLDTIHLLPGECAGEIKRVLSDGTGVVSTFCNEYNKSEKLFELKDRFKDFNIEKEFFAGEEEMDAVIVIRT